MRREARQVRLRTPCSLAYDFLVDYRNDPRWRPELRSVQVKSGIPGQPGVVYEGSLEWHGLAVEHELEVTECVRPDLIRTSSRSPNLTIEVEYVLAERDDGGCTLTAEYTLDMRGPLVVLEPFGWALLMGWVGDDLPGLDEALQDWVSASGGGEAGR